MALFKEKRKCDLYFEILLFQLSYLITYISVLKIYLKQFLLTLFPEMIDRWRYWVFWEL